MKSVIKEIGKEKAITYPCLMKSKILDIIVLFGLDGCGITVKSNNNDYPLGEVCGYWDIEHFEPFNGTIELSNN